MVFFATCVSVATLVVVVTLPSDGNPIETGKLTFDT